jgi:hypothetical protein
MCRLSLVLIVSDGPSRQFIDITEIKHTLLEFGTGPTQVVRTGHVQQIMHTRGKEYKEVGWRKSKSDTNSRSH